MTEAKFSASKSALLGKCAHWVGKECGPRLDTSASTRGSEVHTAIYESFGDPMERVTRDHLKPFDGEVSQAWQYVDEVLGGYTAAEVVYDVNTTNWTCEEHPWCPDRGYEHLPDHIYGTADLVYADRDKGVLHVLDWKTGRGSGALEQLKTLGAAAYLKHGIEKVVLHAVHVAADKHYHIGVWTYTGTELREHLLDISFNLGLKNPVPEPGHHCDEFYCPYADRCPGLNGSLPKDLQEPLEAPRNAFDVAKLVPALLNKKKRLEAVLEQCKVIAGKEEVVDGGKVWKETFQNRQSMDKDGLVALARRLGATDADLEPLVKTSRSSGGFKWVNKK